MSAWRAAGLQVMDDFRSYIHFRARGENLAPQIPIIEHFDVGEFFGDDCTRRRFAGSCGKDDALDRMGTARTVDAA